MGKMANRIQIQLQPLGKSVWVEPGGSLQQVLFNQGVEFPWGGQGRCKGCRVRVIEGGWAASAEDHRLLDEQEIASGWRLACRATTVEDSVIEVAQWEPSILADNTAFPFSPQPGFGVAVDLGTTTIVAQLLDLSTGGVRAVRSALNAQAQHGGDVMSRIEFSLRDGGQTKLQATVRGQIGGMVEEMVQEARLERGLVRVVVVGNTVMHHLFCGVNVEPLSHHPFQPSRLGEIQFESRDLGWKLDPPTLVQFLPCLGGFVGSDILAGILATGLDHATGLVALVDLGTNGEIVVGNGKRMLCASTAAGPAFEGARISMGMRAATVAISRVTHADGRLTCQVLGDGCARGVCGSGLVDAVAVGLDLGLVLASGKLVDRIPIRLDGSVTINQGDIRELQLAKGAIAAGLELLLSRMGAHSEELDGLYLAGAFGNYISRASARRIGLLQAPLEKIHPCGNTALLGAKMALFSPSGAVSPYAQFLQRVEHVALNEDASFHEAYVAKMPFPGRCVG